MATVETNPQLGAQIKADAKEFVLHSWSVQNAIDPIPVAGAEGRYFWDYDGKRYLDFASQLVNVSIGYGHPKVIAAIKEQAERLATIGPPMATEPRSTLGRRRGERERDQGRALGDGTPQDRGALPQLPRRHGRRDHAHGGPAPLVRGAG